jgi:hypothetical protein
VPSLRSLIEPRRIRRFDGKTTIIVWGGVIPPNVATFSQGLFRGIGLKARCNSLLGVIGIPDGTPRGHEFPNKALMDFRIERRIT